jgi:hypothetical protein
MTVFVRGQKAPGSGRHGTTHEGHSASAQRVDARSMSLVLADTSVWDDVALLASVLLTPGALLWTADKILHAHAGRLDVAFVAARQ